jgi:HAD superfamily hydrolase (TIGR01509 family)
VSSATSHADAARFTPFPLLAAHDPMARPLGGASGVTAVLLDFGGTLDADGVPSSAQFHAAYRARGGTLDAEPFAEAFRAADAAVAARADVRSLGYRAMLAAQGEALAERLPDAATVALAAVVDDVHRAVVATVARNHAVLDALSGFRLGVVSNFTGNLVPCLAELGLLDRFDVVLDSTVVGAAKPAPAIFERALASLGAPAARALMVGDNPFADVRGAAACGLRTCWLASATRPTPDGVHPDLRVTRLDELPALLAASDAPDGAGRRASPLVACTA